MSPFDSILLPLDGSRDSARAVGCAVWLAERLAATLHVLYAAGRPLPTVDALDRLCADKARHGRTVLHQTRFDPVRAVVDATTEHAVKLVVLSARGGSASAGLDPKRRLGRVATALIEDCSVPVLLVPLHYREVLPWRSMLVAASGEPSADQALAVAVRLSTALQLDIGVVYVEDARGPDGALSTYADAPQHEYPRRLDEIVRRATVGAPLDECRCVHAVRIRQGDPATELLSEVARHRSSVVALGWHGALGATRAPVLKELLERAECPLLVVREAKRPRVRLKVGDAIGEL